MFCSIRYAKELKPLFPLTEHPRVKLVAFLEPLLEDPALDSEQMEKFMFLYKRFSSFL